MKIYISRNRPKLHSMNISLTHNSTKKTQMTTNQLACVGPLDHSSTYADLSNVIFAKSLLFIVIWETPFIPSNRRKETLVPKMEKHSVAQMYHIP